MTYEANASYVNVNIAADVLYMHIHYHVIPKIESLFFCSSIVYDIMSD